MTQAIYQLKPPHLHQILRVILKQLYINEDWYYQNIHSTQPTITCIKRYMSYLAYAYGYKRREIGPYIGSDNGSSVSYYAEQARVWLKAYWKKYDSVVRKLVRDLIDLEYFEVDVHYEYTKDVIHSQWFTHPEMKVLVKDIKGGPNWPLRTIEASLRIIKDNVLVELLPLPLNDHVLVELPDNKGVYQLVHKSDL